MLKGEDKDRETGSRGLNTTAKCSGAFVPTRYSASLKNGKYDNYYLSPQKGGHPSYGQAAAVGLTWSPLGSHLENKLCGTR